MNNRSGFIVPALPRPLRRPHVSLVPPMPPMQTHIVRGVPQTQQPPQTQQDAPDDWSESDEQLATLLEIHDRSTCLRWEEDFYIKTERLREDVEWCLALLRVQSVRDPPSCETIEEAITALDEQRKRCWKEWGDHCRQWQTPPLVSGGGVLPWLRDG